MSVTIQSYIVRDMLTNQSRYKGSKEQCIKYLDKHPHLWLVCEVLPDTKNKIVAKPINASEDWKE